MPTFPEPDQPHSPVLEDVARELAALGAETPVERQVKRVAPWVASVAVHVGVAMLALLITWTVSHLPKKDNSILIIADFDALNYEPVARLSPDQAPAGERPIEDRAQSQPLEKIVRDRLAESDDDPLELFAGEIQSTASELSQFAPRPVQTGVTFAGLSTTNARKIVYVIDASGSMISSNYIIIDELARSLENLKPLQSFSLVFFQDNKAIEQPPGKLVSATAEERMRAVKWAKTIIPRGASNPVAAIEKALSLKPDVIFMLSTDITGYGQFEIDQRDLLALLDKRNPINPNNGRRTTQINCIQFLDVDPLETMKMIAQAHGGMRGYKFLSRKDLGISGP